jgi:drug/metabolite transporter (DMT)-like permease
MKKPVLSGSLLVFLGAVFWSLNAPIVQFLSVDPFLLCGLRALIAGVVLIPFIRLRQLRWNGWTVVYLLSYCALCLCIILALNMTSSAIAIGMQYTALIWLFLVTLLRTRKFSLRSFIPVGIICTGVVFFMCSGTDATGTTGNLIALMEGILFALMTTSSKKAAGTNPIGLTSLGNLFTGILILSLFPARTATVVSLSGLDWLLVGILGAVQIGCGYAFYNLGVQKVSAQKAAVISLWEMILGPVWVALFLKDYPSLPVLTGFIIILVGMLLDARLSPQSAPAPTGKSDGL